ncbi:MAG TPA: oxidoreductase-like domain-containing protein [Burkholderiales bacterium]|nr:oxidoreductase-like domain-containing protein [Burkholderiales bacterium]
MSDDAVSGAAPDPKPVPPREPEAGECCQSGCTPCVYDLYWDAYTRYEAELTDWQARQGQK